jgi:hypothetical protein
MDMDIKTPAVYSAHYAIEKLFESALVVSGDELCSPCAARAGCRHGPKAVKSWRIISKLQSKWQGEEKMEYETSQAHLFSNFNYSMPVKSTIPKRTS